MAFTSGDRLGAYEILGALFDPILRSLGS